jgi:hypothetical protein
VLQVVLQHYCWTHVQQLPLLQQQQQQQTRHARQRQHAAPAHDLAWLQELLLKLLQVEAWKKACAAQ